MKPLSSFHNWTFLKIINKFAVGGCFYLILTLVPQFSLADNHPDINQFIMDYPHGSKRFTVSNSGDAFLAYGASPKLKTVKKGVFIADDLYLKFKPYLHENLPREQRPNPGAVYGMIKLIHHDGSESTHLIYDLKELTDGVFSQAEENIVQ